jgi:hypothetical protein
MHSQISTPLFLHPVVHHLFNMASDQIVPAIMQGMLASVHFKQSHFKFSCALNVCHKTTLLEKGWLAQTLLCCHSCLFRCLCSICAEEGGIGVHYQGSISFVLSMKELLNLEISISVCSTQLDSR